jgi:hypothetical protein
VVHLQEKTHVPVTTGGEIETSVNGVMVARPKKLLKSEMLRLFKKWKLKHGGDSNNNPLQWAFQKI